MPCCRWGWFYLLSVRPGHDEWRFSHVGNMCIAIDFQMDETHHYSAVVEKFICSLSTEDASVESSTRFLPRL